MSEKEKKKEAIVNDCKIDDDFVTVNGTDTITEVAKSLAKAGVPDAVVIDKDNKVLGVLDDYDIVSKVLAEEKDPKSVTAEAVMYAPPPVKGTTTLEEVRGILEQLEATILPVVDDEGLLQGVITMDDVLDAEEPTPSLLGRLLGR